LPSGERERAILVGLELRGQAGKGAVSLPKAQGGDGWFQELETLATSAGAEVVSKVQQTRESAVAATLIGAGKLQELKEEAEAFEADLILFDRNLSPTQLRNLEKSLLCKILDRTQLILDIFARRARTREGQLQVELAQLNYLLPRLTGRGVAMSRLGGGIGTRGPGETQLETDRRRIFRRIRRIEQELESVRSHRGVQRQQRRAVPLATVALVGYTNAGKSTLFNRLTGAGVLADAKMFATLDPTVRQIVLPSRRRALLSDTVGFISNLPSTLVKAFRATLEEVTEASLLLHLVDSSAVQAPEQMAQVMTVLSEIGAASTPQLLVLTKTDRLGEDSLDTGTLARRLLADAGVETESSPKAVAVSALKGEGMEALLETIDEMLAVDPVQEVELEFPHADTGQLHLVHEYGRVLESRWKEEGCRVRAEIPESIRRRLRRFETG